MTDIANIKNAAMQEKKNVKNPAQQRKKIQRQQTYLRAALQLLFFIAMPGAFVAGFSGVKYLFLWMGTGAVLELNSFIKILIGLGLFTILFGRFFCGYICAFGTVGDFVYWLSGLVQKKLFKKKRQYRPSAKLLRIGQKLKYVNLAFILIGCTLGFYAKLGKTSPWDVFSQLTALRLPKGYVIGILFCILIVAGMALCERFFCQCLCPMGAVFALLPTFPFGMLQRDSGQCIKGCNACRKQCPVDIKLEQDGIRNGECISCGKCARICPKGNLKHVEQAVLKKEWISVLLKSAFFFAMGSYLGLCRFL